MNGVHHAGPAVQALQCHCHRRSSIFQCCLRWAEYLHGHYAFLIARMILSLGAGIESWLAHGTKSREQYQGSNPAEHPWLLNSMVTYSDLRGTANEHSLWRPRGCLSSNGWTVMDSDGHDWAISWRVMAVCIHPFDLKLECLEPARSAAGPENCPVRMHIPGEGRRLSATT